MQIISKFMPSWAIPNEKIPLNVVWEPEEDIKEIM